MVPGIGDKQLLAVPRRHDDRGRGKVQSVFWAAAMGGGAFGGERLLAKNHRGWCMVSRGKPLPDQHAMIARIADNESVVVEPDAPRSIQLPGCRLGGRQGEATRGRCPQPPQRSPASG